jgi:DNA-binding transcriptional regulator YiaG
MERANWTDLGHGRGTLATHALTHTRHVLRATRERTAVRLEAMTYPPYLREKARELRRSEALTIDEIADRLAVSRTTISFWVGDMPRPKRCVSRAKPPPHHLGNKAMRRELVAGEPPHPGMRHGDHRGV